ncbi:hypothetical protein GCM10009780_25050 [Actinomadura alba]
MPYKPSPGLLHPLAVGPKGGRRYVFVVMNRDVHIMERPGQFARFGVGPGEMRIEDGGGVHTLATGVIRPPRPAIAPMVFFVGIRLAITRQRRVGIQVMQPQSVVIQAHPGSERSMLGRLAHRRTEDSILLIMLTACQNKRIRQTVS